MNFLAIVFNIVLFLFTCFVLLTDGISKEAAYFLLTIFLLLVPVLNLVMISLGAKRKGWFSFNIRRITSAEHVANDDIFTTGKIMITTALISNISLLGLSCWAFLDQYPHPKEDGLIVFILLLLLTPIISLLVVLRNGVKIIHDDMNE